MHCLPVTNESLLPLCFKLSLNDFWPARLTKAQSIFSTFVGLTLPAESKYCFAFTKILHEQEQRVKCGMLIVANILASAANTCHEPAQSPACFWQQRTNKFRFSESDLNAALVTASLKKLWPLCQELSVHAPKRKYQSQLLRATAWLEQKDVVKVISVTFPALMTQRKIC